MKSQNGSRLTQVGLDRLVRLEWLDRVAMDALAGVEGGAIKESLQSELAGSFRSDNTKVRGSLDKTITILLKVWVKPPAYLHSLRADGLNLLSQAQEQERVALHWGMVTAVYPFWSNVAIQVGRLLALQGHCAPASIQRRIREQYGERETVARRARYVLRSFVDWGVLTEANKGVYSLGDPLPVDNPGHIAWLVEALLHARKSGSAPYRELLSAPALFPFELKRISPENLVASSNRLELLRHGLDDDLIVLKRQ